MQKNEVYTVKIEDIGMNGEGIGKADGFTLFIKDAIPGDVVEAKITKCKKNYGFARVMNVLEPSKSRVTPFCNVAKQCGGCQIQEMEYSAQLDFKWKKVYGDFKRIAEVPDSVLDFVMEPIVGMDVEKGKSPARYRNKAQFPIRKNKDGKIVAGFFAGRTHYVIEQSDCQLGVEINQKIVKTLIRFMEKNHILAYDEEKHQGLVRHLLIRYGFVTNEIMVCVVMNGNKLPKQEQLVEDLLTIPGMTSITLNINKEKSNVIMGTEMINLYGPGYITDYIGEVKYQISPLSFYQVNPEQTKKLYDLALEYADLKGEETVWDLYCGIGTISLFLAKAARQVYGVEIIPAAIDNAKENANINSLDNVDFYVGKAEEVLPDYYAQYEKEHSGSHAHADVIVVDPPRKGCEESLLQTMVDMEPERIVYVSCDPATLARDVKFLRGNGYELQKVRPVDQFPHTIHVETVCSLHRIEKKNM